MTPSGCYYFVESGRRLFHLPKIMKRNQSHLPDRRIRQPLGFFYVVVSKHFKKYSLLPLT